MPNLPNLNPRFDSRIANVFLAAPNVLRSQDDSVSGSPGIAISLQELLNGIWAMGNPRSGKSAMMTSLILQVLPLVACMRGGGLSIVVLDMKGDRAMFWATYTKAREYGIPVRLLNTMSGYATHLFPVLAQAQWKTSQVQAAELAIEIFGLDYGSDYGRAFFTSQNETLARASFASCFRNFREFRRAAEPNSASERRASLHLLNELEKASEIAPINTNPDADDDLRDKMIDIASLFQRPQLIYCFLPDTELSTGNFMIARAFMALIRKEAVRHPPGSRLGVWVVGDEADRFLSNHTEKFLTKAPGFNVGTCLAHQHIGQLRTPDGRDFTRSLSAGTNIKFDFTPSENVEFHTLRSRTYVEYRKSPTYSTGSSFSDSPETETSTTSLTRSESVNYSPVERPLFSINELLDITREKNRCLINIAQQTKPFGWGGDMYDAYVPFSISAETHAGFEATDMPKDDSFLAGMITNPSAAATGPDNMPLIESKKKLFGETREKNASQVGYPTAMGRTETWDQLDAEAEHWIQDIKRMRTPDP